MNLTTLSNVHPPNSLSRLLYLTILLLSAQSSWAEVINLNNQQFQEILPEDIFVVDVRRAEEWLDTGVVEGSAKITFFDAKGKYDARAWLDQVAIKNPANKPLVLICHSGVRSKIIADWLSNQVGVAKVYNVAKGVEYWIAAGHPTTQ